MKNHFIRRGNVFSFGVKSAVGYDGQRNKLKDKKAAYYVGNVAHVGPRLIHRTTQTAGFKGHRCPREQWHCAKQ